MDLPQPEGPTTADLQVESIKHMQRTSVGLKVMTDITNTDQCRSGVGHDLLQVEIAFGQIAIIKVQCHIRLILEFDVLLQLLDGFLHA